MMSAACIPMSTSDKTIIMGVDPGLAATGYGLILKKNNQDELIDYGCIQTESSERFATRLLIIHEKLNEIIIRYQPTHFAVEELFFAKNVKSALKVGQALGVVKLTAALSKIPLFEFTPLQIKQALAAYGRADKSQIQKMVRVSLGLSEIPSPSHAADALAVAICASSSLRMMKHMG